MKAHFDVYIETVQTDFKNKQARSGQARELRRCLGLSVMPFASSQSRRLFALQN